MTFFYSDNDNSGLSFFYLQRIDGEGGGGELKYICTCNIVCVSLKEYFGYIRYPWCPFVLAVLSQNYLCLMLHKRFEGDKNIPMPIGRTIHYIIRKTDQ